MTGSRVRLHHHRLFRAGVPTVALAVVLIATVLAPSQDGTTETSNLVENGTFDVDASGWGGGLEWDAAEGASAPGSGRLTNILANEFVTSVLSLHCFEVVPGRAYTATAMVRAPVGQPRLDGGYLFLGYVEDGECGLGDGIFSDPTDSPEWTLHALEITIPAGVTAGVVALGTQKDAPGDGGVPQDPVFALFDDVVVIEASSAHPFRAFAPNAAADD